MSTYSFINSRIRLRICNRNIAGNTISVCNAVLQLFISFLFLFLSITTASNAVGDTLKFEPWISFEQEYSDNVLFVTKNTKDDNITTFSPSFSVKKKTARLNGDITAAVDAVFYQNLDELNAVDKRSSASLSYLFTERLQLEMTGGYLEDSRTDREVGETGLVFAGDREQIRGGLSGQYQLSEVSAVGISTGYLTEDIDS